MVPQPASTRRPSRSAPRQARRSPPRASQPAGGDSPEAALDAPARRRRAARPGGRSSATLNPNEFQALQRYAPLFLDDAQDQLDAVEGVVDRRSRPARTRSPAAATPVDVTMTRLTAEITAEGESATIDLSDGCWTVESAGRDGRLVRARRRHAVARRGGRRSGADRGPAASRSRPRSTTTRTPGSSSSRSTASGTSARWRRGPSSCWPSSGRCPARRSRTSSSR